MTTSHPFVELNNVAGLHIEPQICCGPERHGPDIRAIRLQRGGSADGVCERSVLLQLARGLTNRQIAGQIQLAESTVLGYISALLSKFHVATAPRWCVAPLSWGSLINFPIFVKTINVGWPAHSACGP